MCFFVSDMKTRLLLAICVLALTGGALAYGKGGGAIIAPQKSYGYGAPMPIPIHMPMPMPRPVIPVVPVVPVPPPPPPPVRIIPMAVVPTGESITTCGGFKRCIFLVSEAITIVNMYLLRRH